MLSGVASLDLCLIRFASESQRVARLQVMYADANGAGPALQVVMYRPGGAALAYNELINGVKRCPTSYHEGGIRVTKVEVEPLDDSLLPKQLSIVQAATINGAMVWSSAIFQFDGPYLVVAYSNPYTTKAAALLTALDLARKASDLLQHPSGDASPTAITD